MSIYAKTAAGWQEIGVSGGGELPGLGGWAEITAVSGSPKRYAYNDGSTDWVAFEWTANGSLRTQAGGLADVLVISGGSGACTTGGYQQQGGAGDVVWGVKGIPSGPLTVTVGKGGPRSGSPDRLGLPSSIGTAIQTGYGRMGTGLSITQPENEGSHRTFTITGNDVTYGQAAAMSARPNRGDGGNLNTTSGGSDGVVIVRVPAAQAAGVPASEYVDVP